MAEGYTTTTYSVGWTLNLKGHSDVAKKKRKKAARGSGETRYLAEQLRDLIDEDDERVCSIAEMAFVSKQGLCRFYSGEREGMTLVTLERLMDYFGLELVERG